MKKISLITVYNNELLLKKMIKSAETQIGVTIDFVVLDNTNNNFKSAAEALNYGISLAKGDVYVFLHQDIEFVCDDVLSGIYDYAVKNKNTVFGAAGVKNRNEGFNGNILSSMYEGAYKARYTSLNATEEVFTLDECLFACYKNVADKVKFDEIACDGWHLYGADFCLQAKTLANMDIFVIPLNVWHKSSGNADRAYYVVQDRLGDKYKKYYKIINTTNGYVYTNKLKRSLQNIYRRVRYGKL